MRILGADHRSGSRHLLGERNLPKIVPLRHHTHLHEERKVLLDELLVCPLVDLHRALVTGRSSLRVLRDEGALLLPMVLLPMLFLLMIGAGLIYAHRLGLALLLPLLLLLLLGVRLRLHLSLRGQRTVLQPLLLHQHPHRPLQDYVELPPDVAQVENSFTALQELVR